MAYAEIRDNPCLVPLATRLKLLPSSPWTFTCWEIALYASSFIAFMYRQPPAKYIYFIFRSLCQHVAIRVSLFPRFFFGFSFSHPLTSVLARTEYFPRCSPFERQSIIFRHFMQHTVCIYKSMGKTLDFFRSYCILGGRAQQTCWTLDESRTITSEVLAGKLNSANRHR